MTSWQFWPGDRVMIMRNDEGVEPGEAGVVVSRWVDTIYAVRTKNGAFHWLDNRDINALNPYRQNIVPGDIVQIKSNEHNHTFIQVGDLVQVVKVMNNVDYYKIFAGDQFYWLANFEIASYFPLATL